jgi:hypothetical protein
VVWYSNLAGARQGRACCESVRNPEVLCSNYDPYLLHTEPVTRSYHSTRITRVTHFILNPIPCRYVSVQDQLVMFPPLVWLQCHEALSCCSREVSSIRKGLPDHNLLTHFLITRFAYCTAGSLKYGTLALNAGHSLNLRNLIKIRISSKNAISVACASTFIGGIPKEALIYP